MKNKKCLYSALAFTFFSNTGYSSVTCGPDLIDQVLVYDTKVVVKHGAIYRGLGFTDTAKNQDKKLSLVLTAKAASIPVSLSYADGFDCNVHDYGQDPEMVVLR
jgi:hypothetical protein